MSAVNMSGKVCLVTGANSGIGLETCLSLATMGARVIMACRNPAKGEDARLTVASKTRSETVDLILLDLASQKSIRDFAKAIEQKYGRLDVLINNAAIVPTTREETADGLEMQFGVNHIGPFLLTLLLQDRLRASAPSRIVNVSSTLHLRARIDFDDLNSTRKHSYMRAYGQSKLANVLFTYELARRLAGTGVTVNCLHPGGVRTNLLRDIRGPLGLLIKLGGPVLLSPARGARTSVYLATSPAVEDVTGKYFIRSREARSSAISHDAAVAKRLWDISAALTGVGL